MNANKIKSFEIWFPLLLNLNKKFPFVCCKLFTSKTSLSSTDANVKRYLNYLMDTYRNNGKRNEIVTDILKIHLLPQLLIEKFKIMENIKSLSDFTAVDDEEMKKIAKEEELMYQNQLLVIDEKILDVILKNLGTKNYENIILELTPGIGGHEAMLFAKDLLNMYIGYLTCLGLDYEIIEIEMTEQGGLRKATVIVCSCKAYRKLMYESGIHRVQRVPVTDKQGRVHTSTVTVAILPEPRDIEINLHQKDLKIETKRATGAGGQHVNCTDSAVRITHIPTGTVVNCQVDRSQIRNKKLAMMKLKSTLYEQQSTEQDTFITELRKAQVGIKSRSKKIRTYNYTQDRITDHRIAGTTMHYLKDFMKGGLALEKLQDELHLALQQKILLEIIQNMESELK
ncbi:mitochondrial translation release factor 1 isoform X2 [Ptiloglossa arizonensis]|uniref:mitochondrial translation release factor 1 isoform X2 n=1 Tax=Ptiloglossa arizonensis TaxID=3350558 RepID=UPI003FA03C80